MRSRLAPYLFVVLVALVLALLPGALWIDMVVPMAANWNNWYWKGQPHPRPQYSFRNPPALFRAEVATFKALAIPPGLAHRLARGVPTDYASPWLEPHVELAGLPPLASTLQHLRWAVPFWFGLGVLMYEAARVVRGSSRRRAA